MPAEAVGADENLCTLESPGKTARGSPRATDLRISARSPLAPRIEDSGKGGRPLVKCPVCDLVQVVFRSAPLTTLCFHCGATWVQDGPEQSAVRQASSIRKEKSHADTSH